ncbi:MAG: hypothetical protein ACK5RG_18595 [Cyclobacteriaceae bacterium]|jgi:hypothetical protein|nr:hypothetical protein [Flammeovirgaceae bacterium]
MKKIFNLIFVFSSMVLLVHLTGCGGSSSGPAAKEVNTQKLIANTWKLSTVTVDAVDKTVLYAGLTVKFTATSYTSTSGGVVWPATGTWSFTDEAGKIIKRSDNQEITITEISDTALKLTLTRTQGSYGPDRIESVAGVHVFSLVKQ